MFVYYAPTQALLCRHRYDVHTKKLAKTGATRTSSQNFCKKEIVDQVHSANPTGVQERHLQEMQQASKSACYLGGADMSAECVWQQPWVYS